MSELDDFIPRPIYNGRTVCAAEVMLQAARGEFESVIHANMARENGILPKKFVIKGSIPPVSQRRYRSARYR